MYCKYQRVLFIGIKHVLSLCKYCSLCMLDQSFSFRSVLVVVIYLILILQQNFTATPGANFLGEILTKVLGVFLLVIHSQL